MKLRVFSYLFSSVLLFAATGRTEERIRLFEWSPGNTLAPIILPVRAHEKPEDAASRYLRELQKNAELMELFEGRAPHLQLTGFQPLEEVNRENRALMIANLPKDYTRNSQRLVNFKKIFAKARQNSYILPMNANLGLTQEETRDLFKQISEKFPFLVAMGGDDVEPSLYKKENIHSRNTIPARDKFEIALIKSYVAEEKGFLLGVCRGSQISAVALGYELIQDIPSQVQHHDSHANDWHDIVLKKTKYNILGSLAQGAPSLYVNSLHHQSVIYKKNGPLEIAAIGEDNVTEATEFKNGRGLLLQFHPELMNNELGAKILWRVVLHKNSVTPLRCSKIF